MPSRRLPAELAEEEPLIIDPFAPLILPLQHADAASIEKLYTQEGCTMQVSFFMPCSQPRCSDAELNHHSMHTQPQPLLTATSPPAVPPAAALL